MRSIRHKKGDVFNKLRRVIELERALKLVWQSAPGWASVNIVLMTLQGLLPALRLYLTKAIIDAVTSVVAASNRAYAFEQILPLIALAGALAVFQAFCRSSADFVNRCLAEQVTDRMYDLLHAKSIEVDLEYYEHSHYHDTLHRAQQEAPFRPLGLLNNVLHLGRDAIGLFGMLGLLFAFHWGSALLLLVAVAPYIIIRVHYAEKFYTWQRSRTSSERRSWYFSWLLCGEEHAKEIRLFDLGPLFIQRFRESRTQLRTEKLQLAARRAFFEFLIQCISILAMFAAYGVWAVRAVQGLMTVGALIMNYQAFQRGQHFLRGALGNVAALYEDSLFLANLYEFFDLESKIPDPPNPKPFPSGLREGIRVEGISFRYPGASHNALDELSLYIRSGEKIALVGENGAGKSTLVKLLCRLYEPDSGAIFIDNTRLSEFRATDLRREMSVLFQNYAHYNVSARENIRLGDVRLSPEHPRIHEAARLAGADELIRSLPQGYDSILGKWFDEGEELSGGEWQKIALARAFLREAQIVVLDEPSSSLDAKAEYELFTRFRELARKQTAILISHRFSTVRMADRIYVLDNGRIVEHGSHEELLRYDGMYAELFHLQAQHYR